MASLGPVCRGDVPDASATKACRPTGERPAGRIARWSAAGCAVRRPSSVTRGVCMGGAGCGWCGHALTVADDGGAGHTRGPEPAIRDPAPHGGVRDLRDPVVHTRTFAVGPTAAPWLRSRRGRRAELNLPELQQTTERGLGKLVLRDERKPAIGARSSESGSCVPIGRGEHDHSQAQAKGGGKGARDNRREL